jgi:DNA-binding GntR family transcriptional regulator
MTRSSSGPDNAMATNTPLKNSTRGTRKSRANDRAVVNDTMTEEAASAATAEPGRGKLPRPSGLAEDVYARIREDIMSLKIAPDARISVDSLSRELGVSQTPIREALSMLEANGLVTKQRFIGYCCAPTLNRKQFEELYEIRLLVEPYATRRAAEEMSDKALIELCGLALAMNPAEANRSRALYDHFADQDAEFHERIARGSGNQLIAESLARLHIHLHIFRLRFHGEVTNEAHAEHSLVTRALQRRDPDEAERAMRKHIQKSYERLVKFTRP